MYETVKIVNGYEIKRKVGVKGYYRVDLPETKVGWKKQYIFRTIKAAASFIQTWL